MRIVFELQQEELGEYLWQYQRALWDELNSVDREKLWTAIVSLSEFAHSQQMELSIHNVNKIIGIFIGE